VLKHHEAERDYATKQPFLATQYFAWYFAACPGMECGSFPPAPLRIIQR